MNLKSLLVTAILPGWLLATELGIKNTDFSEGEKYWKNAIPASAEVAITDGKLKMTVCDGAKTDGAFTQSFPVSPNTKLAFHADISAEASGMAYLAVVLSKGNQQIATIRTITIEKNLPNDLFFNTGNADQVTIKCCTISNSKHVGKSAVFSNITVKPDTATRRIFIAGDSTVQSYTAPEIGGWGEMLQKFCPPEVQVVNLARSGCSTVTFVKQKRWENLVAQLSPGDLVLVQFGHNDQKKDKPQYAPAFESFQEYLRNFINDVHARQANIALCTPVVRRLFNGDKIRPSLGDYPEAMRQVGTETHTPVLDLNSATLTLLEQYGPQKSGELFRITADNKEDRSHFNKAGAELVAREVARMLTQQKIIEMQGIE